MKILVTGGTGFVGRHLVPRLVSAGHDVRVLARGVHHREEPAAVSMVKGDVASGEGLDAALLDVDVVIHLVAVIRERGSYTFAQVNHVGTANVVQAMQRQGIRRLVHLSALGATADPRFRYTNSKWNGEQEVRASKLHFTIFRPSILFGRDSDFLASIRRSAAPMPLIAPVPGTGKTEFQPIWVEDVVTCIMLTLERADTVGQTYEIGGPEYLCYDEILDLVLQTLGLRRIKVHIPLAIIRPAVAIMEHLLPNPLVTTAELTQLEVDNVAELDSVARSFGFPPARLQDKIGYLREI